MNGKTIKTKMLENLRRNTKTTEKGTQTDARVRTVTLYA